MGVNEEDRGQRAEDGRAAMHAMLRGFREVTAVTVGLAGETKMLAQQITLLSEQLADLTRQNAELATMVRMGCEHSAALQAQIGALVSVLARGQGQPVGAMPPPGISMQQDPFGQLGAAVVNGAIDHLRGRRGRGAPRPY